MINKGPSKSRQKYSYILSKLFDVAKIMIFYWILPDVTHFMMNQRTVIFLLVLIIRVQFQHSLQPLLLMASMLMEVLMEDAVDVLVAEEAASLGVVEDVRMTDSLLADTLHLETMLLLLEVTLLHPTMFLSTLEKRNSEDTMLATLPEIQLLICCSSLSLEYLVKTTQSMPKSLKLPFLAMDKLTEVGSWVSGHPLSIKSMSMSICQICQDT